MFIDGVPLAKSSNVECWPTMFIIDEFRDSMKPAIASIHVDKEKPSKNYLLYFDELVNELNDLIQNGYRAQNRWFAIKVRRILADTPGRAFIKNIKNHNGYYACNKCYIKGLYSTNYRKIIYTNTNSTLRTNQSFRLQSQIQHHNNNRIRTPLEKIVNLDMINDFPVSDDLHLIHLGVMKAILKFWLKESKYSKSVNISVISNSKINDISNMLHCLKLPTEFNRQMRHLKYVKMWKATEFRFVLN